MRPSFCGRLSCGGAEKSHSPSLGLAPGLAFEKTATLPNTRFTLSVSHEMLDNDWLFRTKRPEKK
jgi:hypothetical protein